MEKRTKKNIYVVPNPKDHEQQKLTKKKIIRIKPAKWDTPVHHTFIPWVNETYDEYRIQRIIELQKNPEMDEMEEKTPLLDLQPLQQFVRDYFATNSPFRGILLYHGLGSGKTLASIAVANEFLPVSKQYKVIAFNSNHLLNAPEAPVKDCFDCPIQIFHPARLRQNYLVDMMKFYTKQYTWTRIGIEPITPENIHEYHSILANYPQMVQAQIIKTQHYWMKHENGTPFDELENEAKTEIEFQVDYELRHQFNQINYNAKTFSKKYNQKGFFDNKVVVIDEVHNFIGEVRNAEIRNEKNKKNKPKTSVNNKDEQRENRCEAVYNKLMESSSVRIVALSGTPIVNHVFEIGILFNLLKGPISLYELDYDPEIEPRLQENTHIEQIIQSPDRKHLYFSLYPFSTDREIIIETLQHELHRVIRSKQSKTLLFPTNEDKFNELFVAGKQMNNRALFKSRIVGLVSYYETGEQDYAKAKGYYHVSVPMSEYQFNQYLQIRGEEKTQKRNAIKRKQLNQEEISGDYRVNSLIACDIALPRKDNEIKYRIVNGWNDTLTVGKHIIRLEDSVGTGTNYTGLQLANAMNTQFRRIEALKELSVSFEEATNKFTIHNNTSNDYEFKSRHYMIKSERKTLVKDLFGKGKFIVEAGQTKLGDQLSSNIAINLEEIFRTDPAHLSLPICSPKFDRMISIIRNQCKEGKIFVYSKFIHKSLHLFGQALQLNNWIEIEFGKNRIADFDGVIRKIIELKINHIIPNLFVKYHGDLNEATRKLVLNFYNGVPFQGQLETQVDKICNLLLLDFNELNEDDLTPFLNLNNGAEELEEQLNEIYELSNQIINEKEIKEIKKQVRENTEGRLCKALLGSGAAAEGLTFNAVRHVLIMSADWNPYLVEQVIGRAIRYKAHEKLPKDQQNVTVYIFTTDYKPSNPSKVDQIFVDDNQTTTDRHIFNVMNDKADLQEQFYTAMKEIAVDCTLNKPHHEATGKSIVCYTPPAIMKKYNYLPDIYEQKQLYK